jgi:WD40 repeat protein
VYTGSGAGGTWLRLADGDGDIETVPSGARLGGDPVANAFTPDGRRVNVLVTTPDEGPAGASSWRLVQIPLSGDAPRVVVAGSLPTPRGELSADFAKDGSSVVIWGEEDAADATLVDLATAGTVAVAPPARDVSVLSYRALSSGAAVLWDDGVVTLVDRAGAAVQELRAHAGTVWDVALAPDGTWAATVGQGAEVVLWDVEPATGRWTERESLEGHDGDVFGAEIDPAGEHLVTAAGDNELIVWEVGPDGGFGTSHPGLADRWVANDPAVVEPGRLVVAPTRLLDRAGEDGPYFGAGTVSVAATFIDPRTGIVVGQVEVGDTVEDAYFGASAAVSPDGRSVAVTSGLATTVLDTRTREVVGRVVLPANGDTGVDGSPYPAGVVCCAVWTPDGSRLLVGTGGYLPGTLVDSAPRTPGEIAVVDTATWDVVDRVRLDRVPEVMELDPDGRSLVVASANSSEVVILDADTLDERRRVPLSVGDSFWAMSFSPDGRLLAGGGESGKVHVFDTDTWQAREAVPIRDGPTIQLDWLRDNRTVLSTSVTGDVILFDTERVLVRTPPLPASVDGEEGFAHVLPAPDDEMVLFNDDRVGLRYSMDPADWLREACGVAGRELTRAEWDRYLPGRDYEPTCSDPG